MHLLSTSYNSQKIGSVLMPGSDLSHINEQMSESGQKSDTKQLCDTHSRASCCWRIYFLSPLDRWQIGYLVINHSWQMLQWSMMHDGTHDCVNEFKSGWSRIDCNVFSRLSSLKAKILFKYPCLTGSTYQASSVISCMKCKGYSELRTWSNYTYPRKSERCVQHRWC